MALRSHHGEWVVVEGDGKANANRSRRSTWETFSVVTHGDGTVSFKSHRGKYLVAEKDGRLNASRGRIEKWERFRLQDVR